MWVLSLGWEESLEKEMAPHSSIVVWKIPWTEEPCLAIVLGVTKSQTQLKTHTHTHTHTANKPPAAMSFAQLFRGRG